MIEYIFLNKNDRVKVIHHINDEENLLKRDKGNYYKANEDMFMLAEYYDNSWSMTIKHIRQTRKANLNDVLLNENHTSNFGNEVDYRALRDTLNSLNFETVYVWGGYNPILLKNEFLVNNFSMSGTTFFILNLDNSEHRKIIEQNINLKKNKERIKNIIKDTEDKAKKSKEYIIFNNFIMEAARKELNLLSELEIIKKWWNKVCSIAGFGVGTGPTTVSMGWEGMDVFLGHSGSHNQNTCFCYSYEEACKRYEEEVEWYVETAQQNGYPGHYGGSFISKTNLDFLRNTFLSLRAEEKKEVIKFIGGKLNE